MIRSRRMQDRNKWAFWGFVAAAALLVCLPSTMLLDAFRRYRNFAEDVDPAGLRPRRVRYVPHGGGASGEAPDLDFVEFGLTEAKAKDVELVGDFNNWTRGTMKLNKKGSRWEILLPLPKGRYRYVFLVDGQRRLDPKGEAVDGTGDEQASVRTVK